MKDKIRDSYQASKNIYDDVLTQGKWWSRLYIRLFWQGVDDVQIAGHLLRMIPDDFKGRLLDVPVGTAVFTYEKYQKMEQADITGLDYSLDMLEQARRRLPERIALKQGDVGALPYEDASFDIVLSMNGFHAFPDKEKAYQETYRVLKPGGQFIGCFYIKGESRVTDLLVGKILARRGWFTPPFESALSLKERLAGWYDVEVFDVKGSIVLFSCKKRDA
ncbi:MAG: class I SAM-dependent methyltransferase [Solobacterium sp.]|nr:class I SAM-dependent methyltransferase [Solobacterium sp.]